MTDADAFIAAIDAAPSDDLPRLVYADWLDEHGQPEQAEFIRAQCEVARIPNSDPRRIAARSRDKAAWAALRKRWVPILDDTGITKADFDRGFFYRPVRVRASGFVRRSRHWWPHLPLRQLVLAEPHTDAEGWNECGYLARVEYLMLMAAYDGRHLSGFYHGEQEYQLGTYGEMPFSIIADAAGIASVESLQHLRITPVLASRSAIRKLADAPWLSQLRRLELELILRRPPRGSERRWWSAGYTSPVSREGLMEFVEADPGLFFVD